jgi:carboxymethylenebutenolidase
MTMTLDRRIIELYDEYTHKPLPRRDFMERLVGLTGSAGAAAAALAMLEPNYAHANVIAPDDARITTAPLSETVGGVAIKGLLAQPRTTGGATASRLPAVLVIHENRGLNPHIQDVTRRFAVAGFLALGLDFLTPLGGTPTDADAARAMFPNLKPEQILAQGRAAIAFLKAHARGNGKVGAVGFCWGGGTVNRLAVSLPDLSAGVVYYGVSPRSEDVASIKAAMLLHYAARDERINAGVPAYEAALKVAGKRYALHMYPDVDHAFNNDTSAERYNKAAAELSWNRTLAFFRRELAA